MVIDDDDDLRESFRDILEVRRGDRDDPYDLFWKHPPPLVPRQPARCSCCG